LLLYAASEAFRPRLLRRCGSAGAVPGWRATDAGRLQASRGGCGVLQRAQPGPGKCRHWPKGAREVVAVRPLRDKPAGLLPGFWIFEIGGVAEFQAVPVRYRGRL